MQLKIVGCPHLEFALPPCSDSQKALHPQPPSLLFHLVVVVSARSRSLESVLARMGPHCPLTSLQHLDLNTVSIQTLPTTRGPLCSNVYVLAVFEVNKMQAFQTNKPHRARTFFVSYHHGAKHQTFGKHTDTATVLRRVHRHQKIYIRAAFPRAAAAAAHGRVPRTGPAFFSPGTLICGLPLQRLRLRLSHPLHHPRWHATLRPPLL